jgi:hypothetical protein
MVEDLPLTFVLPTAEPRLDCPDGLRWSVKIPPWVWMSLAGNSFTRIAKIPLDSVVKASYALAGEQAAGILTRNVVWFGLR